MKADSLAVVTTAIGTITLQPAASHSSTADTLSPATLPAIGA